MSAVAEASGQIRDNNCASCCGRGMSHANGNPVAAVVVARLDYRVAWRAQSRLARGGLRRSRRVRHLAAGMGGGEGGRGVLVLAVIWPGILAASPREYVLMARFRPR